MKKTIVNLTGENLIILDEAGAFRKFVAGPSSSTPRIKTEYTSAANVNGITIYMEFIINVSLPNPVEGVLYLVTKEVAEAAVKMGRTDVLYPGELNSINYDSSFRNIYKGFQYPNIPQI